MTDFDQFWTAYPRRVKKGYARQCYERALKKASHEEIMAGLRTFVIAEPWEGRIQFCPHPSSWLNGEQWDDEYDAPGSKIDQDIFERAKRADQEEEHGQQQAAGSHLRLI